MLQAIGYYQDREGAAGLACRTREYLLILGRPGQAQCACKTSLTPFQDEVLDAETSASLGTACLDDCAAVLGGHAGTKTVGTRTMQIAGLEGSFHDR